MILYHGVMLDASTQALHVHSEFVSGGSLRRLLGRMAPLEVTVVRAYSSEERLAYGRRLLFFSTISRGPPFSPPPLGPR